MEGAATLPQPSERYAKLYGKYGVVSSITGQLVNGNTDMFSPGVGALQVRRPTLQ